ncbi:phage recombination protein Bet [Listeria monocytogenes]|nr:phage recombination protein Bet [Listeria monocytogenes]
MSNDLMTKAIEYDVAGEKVKLSGNMIREYLVSGEAQVTDQEVVMFLQLCKYQRLNPFLKEAYLVKFNGRPAQIIVAKEAFMKRAEAHEQFDGFEAGIIVSRENEIVEIEGAIKLKKDVLLGGWARVYRKDRSRPIVSKISLEEFSKGQSTWNSMPLTMIRKTAIVNAMREAFPDALGAMYTEEESDMNMPTEQFVQSEIEAQANAEVLDMPAADMNFQNNQRAQEMEPEPIEVSQPEPQQQSAEQAPFL